MSGADYTYVRRIRIHLSRMKCSPNPRLTSSSALAILRGPLSARSSSTISSASHFPHEEVGSAEMYSMGRSGAGVRMPNDIRQRSSIPAPPPALRSENPAAP